MKKIFTLLILLFSLSLHACDNVDQKNEPDPCVAPTNLSEKDIAGTWKTGISERNDTLVFREDGTYKQIIHVENPSFDYESDWLPWTIRVSESDIAYLHLEGLRLCVYWEGVGCLTSGGGKDDWYDFCKKEWVQMPNEGILVVLGPPKGIKLPGPGISLFALQRSTESTTVYEIQQP